MTQETRSITLPEFLTEGQIAEAAALYEAHGRRGSVARIQAQVIEPNMDAINAKLGQENDARYLAHAVAYVLSQARTAN